MWVAFLSPSLRPPTNKPLQDLGANILTGLTCRPNPVFIPQPYTISLPSLSSISSFLSAFPHDTLDSFQRTFLIKPIQFHVLTLATFASLIAPFGGFFASGLKRFAKIKDFGESIPGHGGITDRFDCQFIMGFFTFMYYQSFIAEYSASVGDVLEAAVQGLTGDEQVEVLVGLARHLVNQGLLGGEAVDCLGVSAGGKA
jgi:phosphatidate cytidylyltransferase